MSLKILSHITSFNIDMQKNQLQNAVVHPLASAPASAVAGQIYYNNVSGDLLFYNGSTWVSSAGVTSVTAGNGITVTGTNTVTVTNATVGFTSTTKSGTAVTLTSASTTTQRFTGTGNQTIVLPDNTTLYIGWSVLLMHAATSGTLAIQYNGGTGYANLSANQIARFICTSTTAAQTESWQIFYEGSDNATGIGSLVYSDGPTFVGPILGTPASATLTNATDLPIVAGTTGTLTVARGGTGVTTFTSNGILFGNAGNNLQVTAAGTQHQVLLAGSGGTPAFGALNLSQGAAVTGTLPIGNGGTGSTTGSITGSGALTFTAGGADNNVTLVPTGTGSVNVSSKKITNLAEPTAASDAATKGYVDGMAQGLDLKASVFCASTANIAGVYNNGTAGVGATFTPTVQAALSLDGVSANTVGVRVLIKDQSTQTQNGIYVVTAAGGPGVSPILTRADDFNQPAEIPGAFTFVEQGTTQADRGYVCTTDIGGLVIGTTNITFTQFSSAGSYTASTGITLNGNDFQLATGNVLSLFNISTDGFIARNGSGTVVARTLTGTANQISISNTTGGGNPVFSLPQDIHSGASPTFAGLTINGTVTIRAAATATAATQIPIFTADPSSTARTLVTRTPAELRSDIGAMPEPAGNGIVVRTGSQTSVNRTITGTGGAITSSPAGAGGGIIVTNGDGVSNNPTISLKSYSVAGPSSATNSWTIDHQLNSEALIVTLREVGANGEMVLADTIFLDSNRITFSFVNSQTANTLRVSVLRVD
jgi:hypothetical protein